MTFLADTLSLPGLTLNLLYKLKDEDSLFVLFNQTHSDLHTLLKEQIVGGPSIVWKRLSVAGETRIRPANYEDAKLTDTVKGFDAFSLYLHCIGQDMPTGYFYRRRAEQNVKLEKSCPQSQGALNWLSYVSSTQNTFIHHAGNTGREKRVGAKRVPVDGFHVSSNTVYQFDGCYYHGCSCIETQDALKKQELLLKAKRTKENHEYICGLRFHLIVMRECEWNKLKRQDEQVRQFFLRQYTPTLDPRPMSSVQILDIVRTGVQFGLL